MYTRCSYVVLACMLLSLTGAAAAQSDGADIQIRDGTIVATAADYEMDGTMWTAFTVLEDSTVYIYRSTDHGLSWEYRSALGVWNEPMDRIELVVGEGDSAFNYLFYLRTANNGDLWVARRDASSDSFWNFPVLVGPDTINNFAVCRDYTGDNYWLYAVTSNPGSIGPRGMIFFRSSTYGRTWAPMMSGPSSWRDLHLAGGPGSYIYFAARADDVLLRGINTLYFDANYWHWQNSPLQEEIQDPVIGAAFTMPESTAAVWCAWSQNYQNSGDWDVKFSYAEGIKGWSAPQYLAGSSAIDEQYPDLRNYTGLGNQYINASYISDDNVFRTVYRRYAQASTPDQWSDTLRINEGSVSTGSEIRPKLCYTPGGPFSGAGCVFVGEGLNGCWWNAPYPVAVAEPEAGPAVVRLRVTPAIGPGPFLVTGATGDLLVHDLCGRLVRSLSVEPRTSAIRLDLMALSPGVYFVHTTSAPRPAKVILTK